MKQFITIAVCLVIVLNNFDIQKQLKHILKLDSVFNKLPSKKITKNIHHNLLKI